ncbi:MAG: stage III sporulation protein SpoIIIAB [Eubacteriales bacterium]|nr:stage III sporulation protein AB [Bacillota bacterium]MBV1727259.1 stage III sporulation protein AB [Desulforudis sp.]MDP3050331.1 stage III sporulation protein SpoIIIAB [Eubacteriales bacterium]MDQ7788475.1 stage III sporulation protein SpoIIIAB [Clostridia bacterium]MBV1736101.1 stage III sporulation protein AB [Desulforudis sp.]
MYKIIGAMFVIGAAGFLGLTVANAYQNRPRELRDMQTALHLLETEIAYGATPLVEALDNVSTRVPSPVGRFMSEVARELSAGYGATVREAWGFALNGFRPETFLKEEDLSVVKGLGEVLGASDRADQLKHLRLAIERLKAQGHKADDEAKRNVKLWQCLGFTGGLAVTLILI